MILAYTYCVGRPCDKDGNYLLPFTQPLQAANATADNPWAPFDNRLAFDFAKFHFAELQTSKIKNQSCSGSLESCDCEGWE